MDGYKCQYWKEVQDEKNNNKNNDVLKPLKTYHVITTYLLMMKSGNKNVCVDFIRALKQDWVKGVNKEVRGLTQEMKGQKNDELGFGYR